MKRCFAMFLVALGVLIAMAGVCGAVENMTKEELKSLLGEPGVVVVDVRSRGEWKISSYKIPGAVREDQTDVNSWAAKYTPDTTIVLYCC